MENHFSSPQLFLGLPNSKINIYRTICHNRNGIPTSFGVTDMRVKKEDTTRQSERRQQCYLVYSRPRGKVNLPSNIHNVILWINKKCIKTSVHLMLQKNYFLENKELDEKLFFHLVNLIILKEFITQK